jgi:two-component system response regulator DegU
MSQETRSRVVLLSNRGFLAEGLESTFRSSSDIKMSAVFSDLKSMLRYLASSANDVDIALIAMEPQIALATLGELRRAGLREMVLWGAVWPELAFHAIGLGLRGVIPADVTPEALRMALKAIRAGRLWFTKDLMDSAFKVKPAVLTPREEELIVLLAKGLKNKELAYALSISEGTVKVYLSRLFKKLGVADRLELALYAMRNLVAGGPEAFSLRRDAAHQRAHTELSRHESMLLCDGAQDALSLTSLEKTRLEKNGYQRLMM